MRGGKRSSLVWSVEYDRVTDVESLCRVYWCNGVEANERKGRNEVSEFDFAAFFEFSLRNEN